MNSAYFNDVFNGFETDDEDEEENGEEEAEVQSMTLNDADPKIFSLVVRWLYSKKFEDASPLALAKLWILCAECKMPFLQNQAMDKIRLLLVAETWPVFGTKKIKELVEHVFDEDNDDTYPLLMRVLIDHFAFLPTAALEAWMNYLPKLLLVNITAVLNRHFNGLPGNMQNWALRKDINYHVDVPGEDKRREVGVFAAEEISACEGSFSYGR